MGQQRWVQRGLAWQAQQQQAAQWGLARQAWEGWDLRMLLQGLQQAWRLAQLVLIGLEAAQQLGDVVLLVGWASCLHCKKSNPHLKSAQQLRLMHPWPGDGALLAGWASCQHRRQSPLRNSSTITSSAMPDRIGLTLCFWCTSSFRSELSGKKQEELNLCR